MWILWWGDGMTKTKKIALCAVLIALALALSYMERFLPLQLFIPLPGVKLGLANIVTLIALYLRGWKSAFVPSPTVRSRSLRIFLSLRPVPEA